MKKIDKKLLQKIIGQAKQELGVYELAEAARRAVNALYGREGELWGTYQHIVTTRLLKQKEERPFSERLDIIEDARRRELSMGLEEDGDDEIESRDRARESLKRK